MKRNFLTFLVAISLVFIPLCFAEITGQLGGMDSDGNYYWTIEDGTLTGGTGAGISLGGAIVANGAVTLGNAVTDVVTVTGKVAGATPLSFDGATADAIYTILAVADATSASKTVTLPSITGTLITTGDTGSVATAMIAANAVTSAKLDEGTIKFAEVALSNAQIKALFTTAVEVVAAPGAGKVVSFVDAIVIHDVGAADFATAHNVTINYGAAGTGAAVSTTLVSPFVSGSVADKISTLKQLTTDITTADKTTQENQPLAIVASANPITGDGVGRVKVWYRVFSTGL